MKRIRVGDFLIGEDEPCFIIAEAGVNHNGNTEIAKKMVDVAKAAGANAIKFQTWKTVEIVTPNVPKPKYQHTRNSESQYDLLKKLELKDKEFMEISEYAKSLGIIFLSTPEGLGCTDFIDTLGVPAFKIGSADLTNHPFLRYIAQKRKPLILSTGMATLDEVKDAVEIIKTEGNHDIILLHCTSNYPTSLENVNLRAMLTMETEFRMPIGYSDHTVGIGTSIIATLMGAKVIEKHFTLNRALPGPDHIASLEPQELAAMVKGIRCAEKRRNGLNMLGKKLRELSTEITIEPEVLIKIKNILGHASKKPTQSEKEMIRLARKYIVAENDIAEGEVFTLKNLSIKRSGGGLDSKHLDKLIGRKAKSKIRKNEIITLKKVVI